MPPAWPEQRGGLFTGYWPAPQVREVINIPKLPG